MKVLTDKTIHSREILKPEMRLPYQTVGFVYKALDIAEKQIEEQQFLIDSLIVENMKLKKSKNRKRRYE